ncbi:MAG: RHS repeat-associated core domain-containing protein [Flavobacteriaceae bacterium]|jgi:RHS repeat-associated protein|nr:RHS repeat-associated core domain-containing protein [Flavobacteriaceae bacterium]
MSSPKISMVSQHVEYIPFGEVFLEEKNDKWNTPYKFNSKEMDDETGLYYFSSRYFDSKLSLFYSVDAAAEMTMTPYQFSYQNPVKYTDPTGMVPEEEDYKEPPIKKIPYFKDDTGQYFWNSEQDAYERYVSGEDGYSHFDSYYSVKGSEKPVGNYEIVLEGGVTGELALKDIVLERNYTDVSREDVGRTITLKYSTRDLQESYLFTREKGSKDTRKFLRKVKEPRSWSKIVAGVTVVTNEYEETRLYGTPFKGSIDDKIDNNAEKGIIKFGAKKLGEFIPTLLKSLKKR